jgi:hypothetical protein
MPRRSPVWPDTWLHPNASLKRQIPVAPRAPPKLNDSFAANTGRPHNDAIDLQRTFDLLDVSLKSSTL